MELKIRLTLFVGLIIAGLGLSVGLSQGIASVGSAVQGKDRIATSREKTQGQLNVNFVIQSDQQGRMNVDPERAAQLREGEIVSMTLGNGFQPERFRVDARHEPCERSAWWRLVSLDNPLTEATLAMRDGFFAGNVRQYELGLQWTLRPIARDVLIPILDQEENHTCGVTHGPNPPAAEAGGVAGAGQICGDCTSPYADIAFFYTELAFAAEEAEIKNAGGDPTTAPFTLGAKAQLECATTTTAIENSELPYSVRLVYVGLTEYDEILSGDQTYLGLFASNGDGVMDEIHAIRDKVAADNCSLITENPPAEGAAGIAIVGGAFNVLNRNSLGYTLHAHEFGHNVGMLHAHGDGPPGFKCESSAPGDLCRMPCETIDVGYNWGWRYFGSTTLCWRTIMAYGPGTGILNFSNPDVIYDGQPTGVPLGESHQANGAKVFRERFPALTGLRCELPEVESEQGRIAAAGGEAFDAFGISVAGNEAIFIGGASLHDSRAIDAGAAYVFAWFPKDEGDPSDPDDDLPERWEQIEKLMPEFLREGDRFGEVLAFDDDVLVVGSPRGSVWETQTDKEGNETEVQIVQSSGYVTIWEWNASTEQFCFVHKIEPPAPQDFDWFGSSIAIHQGRIAVGCPRRDTNADLDNNVGAIFTYNYENGIVTDGHVVYGSIEQELLGSSVALNNNSQTDFWRLLGGAPNANNERGRVFSWTSFGSNNADWVFLEHIDGQFGSGAQFGSSLTMHDLNMAVGAPFADDGVGHVVTYQTDLTEFFWVNSEVLDMPGEEEDSRFGETISMDGSRLVVGAPYSDAPFLERIGAVVVFDQNSQGSWGISDFLRPPGLRAGDELGRAVDIKGNLVFAGAPDADDDGILSGVVYAVEAELEDCNNNFIDDAIDIYLGNEQDLNNNGVPDVCENVGCLADFNGDGIVNGEDLGKLLEQWNPDCSKCIADLNNDGIVNGIDLGLLFAAWGTICEPDKP